MFINQSTVAIIFKLINFVILFGATLFIFKKYLKADILFLIAKKETDYHNLLTQQKMLEKQQRDLDILIKQETEQCHDFKSKIDEWKKIVISEERKQEEEYKKLLIAVKTRNAETARKQENQRIQNSIIDIVIADLEKSLSDDFKNSHKGMEYLNSIMHFMNERTS